MSQPSSSFSSAGEGGGWGLCRSAVLDYVEVLYYDYALLDTFFFAKRTIIFSCRMFVTGQVCVFGWIARIM